MGDKITYIVVKSSIHELDSKEKVWKMKGEDEEGKTEGGMNIAVNEDEKQEDDDDEEEEEEDEEQDEKNEEEEQDDDGNEEKAEKEVMEEKNSDVGMTAEVEKPTSLPSVMGDLSDFFKGQFLMFDQDELVKFFLFVN